MQSLELQSGTGAGEGVCDKPSLLPTWEASCSPSAEAEGERGAEVTLSLQWCLLAVHGLCPLGAIVEENLCYQAHTEVLF